VPRVIYSVTLRENKRAGIVIEVTWKIISAGWLCSVSLSPRRKNCMFLPNSKSRDKWIAQPGSLQLFCDYATKTGCAYRVQCHRTNDNLYLVLFSYFITSMQRHRVRTMIKVTSLMNDFKRLNSTIFWLCFQDMHLVRWSKLRRKSIISLIPLQLFSRYAVKRRNPYSGLSHTRNDWF
jgi:hypothetical protein